MPSESTTETPADQSPPSGTSAPSGAVPDWREIGGRLLEQGAEGYPAWSRLMLRICGQDVRPYLEDIWSELDKPQR